MKIFEFIIDIINKYKFRYIFGIICLILVDGLQLVVPVILKNITDSIKASSLTKRELVWYAVLISLLAVGIALFRFLWRYFVHGASRIIETDLRKRFYAHIQLLSVNYYNNHKTGDLMAHATNDINNIKMALGQGVAMGVDSAIIPVAAIIMMLITVGYKLTLVSFLPLFALMIIIYFYAKRMHPMIEKMQEAFSQLTETARENIAGIRVVKAFVQEKGEIDKFRKSNEFNKEANIKFNRNMSFIFPMIMSISALSFAIALWYGGMLVIEKQITLGGFIAFNSYLGMLIWPMAALGWVMNVFQRGTVSLERINEIMREKPEIKDEDDIAAIEELRGKIVFKNLSFTYPGAEKKTLKNINIEIEAGKTLAVIGKTGSGKTTLVNLISRLFNVEEGSLLIDDISINKIPLKILRRNIGYVPQDSFLFSKTIRENIDFFKDMKEEAIIAVSKTARIYDNIMGFPNKFETMVGERGITLSGGQKQRIAIARALLSSPTILILDDCLSAVDTNTEEEILKGLKEIMRQRTSIMVSHRISTIKDADEIIVLEQGEIAERGTHESLLDRQGIYFDLYQNQLLAEQMEGAEQQ